MQREQFKDHRVQGEQVNGYGALARVLHWLMALFVVAMFALGYWMRTLDYYHPWYQSAPELHKSFGAMLIVLIVIRIFWRLTTPQPPPLSKNRLEQIGAQGVHILLYLLLVAMAITGYVFATGNGKTLSVFGLVELPSFMKSKPVADLAGDVHQWLAYTIIGLAVLHMLAALKHHFVDRDDTLRRMIRTVS